MNTYTMKELKAREGYYLTQVEEVRENRIYITSIKGANVNESEWREATLEEKEAYENPEPSHNPE